MSKLQWNIKFFIIPSLLLHLCWTFFSRVGWLDSHIIIFFSAGEKRFSRCEKLLSFPFPRPSSLPLALFTHSPVLALALFCCCSLIRFSHFFPSVTTSHRCRITREEFVWTMGWKNMNKLSLTHRASSMDERESREWGEKQFNFFEEMRSKEI